MVLKSASVYHKVPRPPQCSLYLHHFRPETMESKAHGPELLKLSPKNFPPFKNLPWVFCQSSRKLTTQEWMTGLNDTGEIICSQEVLSQAEFSLGWDCAPDGLATLLDLRRAYIVRTVGGHSASPALGSKRQHPCDTCSRMALCCSKLSTTIRRIMCHPCFPGHTVEWNSLDKAHNCSKTTLCGSPSDAVGIWRSQDFKNNGDPMLFLFLTCVLEMTWQTVW